MYRIVISPALLALGLLSGCGGPAPESKFVAAPHGGNILELPDSHGFVELKIDLGPPSKNGRKEASKSRVIAYFYQPDAASVLSPAPTDVKVTLGDKVIALAPQPDQPGEFTSAPGNYADLRGQIAFQHDGKPLEAKFSFR
jgi:hypothetical protein